jgi:quercetin dioxygenase-like cupin family protein
MDAIVALWRRQRKALGPKPGEMVPMHRSPENINYILEPGTLRLLDPDGSSVDLRLDEGQVIAAPVGEHGVENVGKTEVRTICIELKRQEVGRATDRTDVAG